MLNRELGFDSIMKTSKTSEMKNITFQVTNDCCLQCTYCYQISKNNLSMTFDIAKTFIDNLFNNAENKKCEINIYNTTGLIIDFVGGEPLMEIDLIIDIIEYFEEKFRIYYYYPWTINHKYHLSSNGLLYFNNKFQLLLSTYGNELISYGITIDGCQQCHDKCRIDFNNQGSYEKSIKAALDYKKNYAGKETKITISPDNMHYIFQSVKNLIMLGYNRINANCIFEHCWTIEEAIIIKNQIIKVKSWLKNNNLLNFIYFSMLDFDNLNLKDGKEELTKKSCGASNNMIAIDPLGDLYPCIRFTPSSMKNNLEPFKLGNVKKNDLNYNNLELLKTYQNSIIFPEECQSCSLKSKCHQCLGCNYELYGTIFKFNKNLCNIYKQLGEDLNGV